MQLIPFPLRIALPLVLFLFVILYEASHVRPADSQIIEAIESEAPSARAVSLRELGILLFGIVPGALAFWWVTSGGDSGMDGRVVGWLHWAPLDGSWQPLWGLGTAASGYVIGAGIGWASRIVFSLILGKEAFGTGDIHMMAAAGCVAGWQVVALGFVLTCFIALFGWLVLIPFKRTRAIPLGPWLSLSFLIVAVMYKPLVATQVMKNFTAAAEVLFFSN
jgi:prepilin signal peptidase PulO-like enzyme (type II secretory pathway)